MFIGFEPDDYLRVLYGKKSISIQMKDRLPYRIERKNLNLIISDIIIFCSNYEEIEEADLLLIKENKSWRDLEYSDKIELFGYSRKTSLVSRAVSLSKTAIEINTAHMKEKKKSISKIYDKEISYYAIKTGTGMRYISDNRDGKSELLRI